MPPLLKQGWRQVRRAEWVAPGGLCQPHKRPLLLTAVQRTLPARAGSAALLCLNKAAVAPSKGPPVVFFHGEGETPPLAIVRKCRNTQTHTGTHSKEMHRNLRPRRNKTCKLESVRTPQAYAHKKKKRRFEPKCHELEPKWLEPKWLRTFVLRLYSSVLV